MRGPLLPLQVIPSIFAHRLLLVGALALSLGCGMTTLASAGEQVVKEGVLHVLNGPDPQEGIETLELEELWRAGGEDDEEVLFGLISQALVDADNNIYLLDSQLSQVEVFSPEGEHLKTLGREGSGPGEFTFAFDMVFMPDGTLGVVQLFPGKIVQLDLEGDPAGTFVPQLKEGEAGGILALVNCLAHGGNLVLTGVDVALEQGGIIQNRTFFLKSFDLDGKPVVHYHDRQVTWDFQSQFTLKEEYTDFVWSRLDVGPEGEVVAAIPFTGYALTRFLADGTVDRVIEREYTPWKRNDRARTRQTAQLQGQLRQLPPGSDHEIEEMEPDVERLVIRPDGSIWVLTSRAMWEPKPGVLKSYDVFSPEGDFIKQVDVVAEGNSLADALIWAEGDLVFKITGFYDSIVGALGGYSSEEEEEAEPMQVVCYRIP